MATITGAFVREARNNVVNADSTHVYGPFPSITVAMAWAKAELPNGFIVSSR